MASPTTRPRWTWPWAGVRGCRTGRAGSPWRPSSCCAASAATRGCAAAEEALPGLRVQIEVEAGKELSALRDQDSYSYELGALYMGARDRDELLANHDRAVGMLPFEFEDRRAA